MAKTPEYMLQTYSEHGGQGAPSFVVDVMGALNRIAPIIGASDHGDAYALLTMLPDVSDAVAELLSAAGKAQDTNREDYVLRRPDVSGLPESERAAFLRGWDAASEAVYRTGLRAAVRSAGGAK